MKQVMCDSGDSGALLKTYEEEISFLLDMSMEEVVDNCCTDSLMFSEDVNKE